MKRAIALIIITLACIAGFFSVKGTLPFVPILGNSMEPELRSGSLLTIESTHPADIKVGDIIIYTVPEIVREHYNYPPTVAHRVVEIKTVPSLGFRTAGDNTGEDPFTVRPADIRGTVGRQIPYLGLPLLFFQSTQGVIFVAIALFLLAVFLFGNELSRGGSRIHRGIFAPVINESRKTSRFLTRKIESTEKKMDSTEQALDKFAAAVGQYAENLSSHTGAIQGLSEASHELNKSAAEQNRVLANLIETQRQLEESRKSGTRPYIAPEIRRDEVAPPPSEPEIIKEESPQEKKPAVSDKPLPRAYPPGCVRNRGERLERALAAEKKLQSTLDRLHQKLDKS